MKIIRFIDIKNQERLGCFDPERPDRARLIQGDIFGEWALTGTEVEIHRILAPIRPCNILALGINYRQHGAETAMSSPDQPVLFLKASSSLIGPGEPIRIPLAGPDRVDYEAELAVVIGKKAKNVSPGEARDYILGYTCANDVSARDWQFDKQKGQWARGKSFDTFCPVGPWIVLQDEVPEPNRLRIRLVLNGEILQDATTADMIFDVPAIVSNLSQSMTLLPGTLILTGTPQGVGFTRTPPVYLKAGDRVSVEIEKVGTLTNPVQNEERDIALEGGPDA